MKKYLLGLISLALLAFSSCQPVKTHHEKILGKYVLVIHGGAGVIEKKLMTPEKAKLYHDKLQQVIDSGELILKRGGTALDAVTKCITMMEDSPLFNAGKGSVFNERGQNEMDASIMDGKNLMAGILSKTRSWRHGR